MLEAVAATTIQHPRDKKSLSKNQSDLLPLLVEGKTRFGIEKNKDKQR
jgi:hypothetical protein